MAAQKLVTLTRPQAFGMLQTVHLYFNDPDNTLGGRHVTEILAESLIHEGMGKLAGDVIAIHNTLREFHKGDFGAAQFFTDSPLLKELVRDAKGTRFEKDIVVLAKELESFSEIVPGAEDNCVNWEKSGKVLAKAKAEKFPEDLTMIERLGQWRRSQSTTVSP